MAEVLGAVASATQLAVMTMGLLDVVKKIKGGSKTLKRYQEQLLEVQALSESISRNPLLQTPDVDFHTRSILWSISQTNLEHRLRRGWLSRTCTFIYKHQDLVDFFVVLDRQKLSLSLVIENIQSRALHQIQADIQTMSSAAFFNEKPATPPDSDDEYPCRTTRTRTGPRTMDSSSSPAPGASTNHPGPSASTHADATDQIPQPSYEPNAHTLQSLETAWKIIERTPKDIRGCHFMANDAGDNVDQHVGLVADFKVIKSLKPGQSINHFFDSYTGNKNIGHGEQNVGYRINFDDEDVAEGANPAGISYAAMFTNNNSSATKLDDKSSQPTFSKTTQHIGPRFVRRPAPGQPAHPNPTRSMVIPVRQDGTTGP